MKQCAALIVFAVSGVRMALAASSIEVHPAGPSVPENLLRIELRCSPAPCAIRDTARLRLTDAAGRTLKDALLDLTLPSADGHRLTVLMDPGRVKTGVGPNVVVGRALHAGSTVRLVIDDASSAGSTVLKQWTITEADAQGPRPDQWQLSQPRQGSHDALIVGLRDAISSAGEGLLAVRGPDGRRVAGRTRLADGDTVWRFTPDRPWRGGDHAVVAHPDLEDPAGNRSCSAFEQARASEAACDTSRVLSFQPGLHAHSHRFTRDF